MPLLPIPSTIPTSSFYQLALQALYDIAEEGTGGGGVPDNDYISLGYTGSNLTSVVYKIGGANGTTVGTYTLAYSGSNLISVTKS